MTSLDDVLEATVVGSFTRPGYAIRSRYFEPLASLEGQTVVITGGTSGIGLAAASQVTALGGRVVIVGRDRVRLDDAATAIRSTAGGEVVALGADLSRLDAVRDLAATVAALDGTLDVLVNNVSVLAPERSVTGDGIELTLATNLVGPFLLTNELIPRLAADTPGRIVTVSSGGMYTQALAVDGLEMTDDGYRGAVAYARTKRAQVVLTELWADRLGHTGVVAHSMHPGWVDTPGLEASLPGFRTVLRPLLRNADEGADTIVYLAAGEEPGRRSGLFWHDRRPRPTHRLSRTRVGDADRDRLWRFLVGRSGWEEPSGWPGPALG